MLFNFDTMREADLSGMYFDWDKPDGDIKKEIKTFLMKDQINTCNNMFRYNGLPDEIPKRCLELSIQNQGYTGIIEEKHKFYSVYGSLGGLPDYNYMPTKCVVANPYLKISKTYEIGKNIVIIPNDPMYMGLLPIHSYYAGLLAENIITMRMATIKMRNSKVFTASDDETITHIQEYYNALIKGAFASIKSEDIENLLQAVDTTDSNSGRTITQLIEQHQYLKASWFNKIGLESNYNMKRESINSNESQLNQDSLRPFVDQMLETRQIAMKQLKDVFGLNITVELNSSWEEMRKPPENEESNQLDKDKGEEKEEKDGNEKDV